MAPSKASAPLTALYMSKLTNGPEQATFMSLYPISQRCLRNVIYSPIHPATKTTSQPSSANLVIMGAKSVVPGVNHSLYHLTPASLSTSCNTTQPGPPLLTVESRRPTFL